MLDAVIRTRPKSSPTSPKDLGDVIAVKLWNSPWAGKDQLHFVVVDWEDPVLEARLNKMFLDGNPFPAIFEPYAEYKIGVKGPTMTRQSTERVNLARLPLEVKQIIADPTRLSPRLNLSVVKQIREQRRP